MPVDRSRGGDVLVTQKLCQSDTATLVYRSAGDIDFAAYCHNIPISANSAGLQSVPTACQVVHFGTFAE